MVLNTPLRCKTLKLIWNEWVPKCWTLQEIPLFRDISRYQKQQFLDVLINSRSWILRKIHCNTPALEPFFNLQPTTLLKKRRRHTYFSVNFVKYFGSNFITENLLRTVFEKRILRKWWTDNLIIKRYRKVDNSFKEQRLWGENYILGPLIESCHWT